MVDEDIQERYLAVGFKFCGELVGVSAPCLARQLKYM
jgi:hypothetical protein